MFRKIIFGLFICSFLLLVGCSSIQSEGEKEGVLRNVNADVTQAYSVPPLKTPPGMKPIPYDPYFVVPDTTTLKNVKPVSLLPPGSLAAEQANK